MNSAMKTSSFTIRDVFNGGLQGFDVSDPASPRIRSWFVPAQGGDLESPESHERSADSVFVEWDRRLIWLATNNGGSMSIMNLCPNQISKYGLLCRAALCRVCVRVCVCILGLLL